MNKTLLRKVAQRIRKNYKHFDINTYHCGSSGCIAFHILKEAKITIKDGGVSFNAAQEAGLTDGQRLRLFHDWHWPKKFSREINDVPSKTRKHAEVAARRIEYFVRTGR